jgi:hypothetical protein
MANVLGNYNEIFFAQEALIWLRNNLGFAGRVFRGMEDERNVRRVGDTIQMRRPRTFTAQTFVPGTGTTAQDLFSQDVTMTLDQHKETKFKISDRELAYTQQRIIDEHIGPAANSVAEAIDESLYALITKVGPRTTLSAADVAAGAKNFFVKPRRTMVENKVPRDPGMWHYMADPEAAEIFLGDEIFHKADTVGGTANQDALLRGSLGNRFGFETFESQLADFVVADLTSTLDASGGGDKVGSVMGAQAVGATSFTIDGLTALETVVIGETTFTIAGDPTVYSLDVGSEIDVGALSTDLAVVITPGLQFPAADMAVVTFRTRTADPEELAGGSTHNLAFHNNAFGLAMAPLPTIGDGAGARISTAVDPESGLAVRARVFYDGDAAELSVALDALWGVVVLNSQLATRVIRPT